MEVLGSLSDDYEVIVVNDGSRDRTAEIVQELQRDNPAVRCISHPQNRGYGAALATGFAAATRPFVFITDGDKQFDIQELRDFLPLLEKADMAIGYREPRCDPLIRRFNGWGWNTLVNLLFGYTARDIDCAFKLFPRRILAQMKLYSTGATFSAEFLIKARRLGCTIVERRVRHFPRPAGKATGARPAVILRALVELFRLRLSLKGTPEAG